MHLTLKTTPVFDRNFSSTANTIVNRGGTRSSKTFSLAQLLGVVKFCFEPNKRTLITRKTLPALKVSAMYDVVELLKRYDIYDSLVHNKSEGILYNPTSGSEIVFKPFDDPQKFRGAEWNYAWFNEGNEVSFEDYQQVELRMSRVSEDGKKNQIFIDFNPDDPEIWIRTELEDKGQCETIISTYRDNSFLSQRTIASIEYLQKNDPNFWNVYGLGQYGQRNKGLIYPAWSAAVEIPEERDIIRIYGLDFGFNKPAALVEITIYGNSIYLRELLYEEGLTNPELIGKMKDRIPNRREYVFADAAEPKSIEEIHQAGFNIHPADKSVKDGILFVKTFTIYVHAESENLKKEIRSYKWKEDKNGISLDEPLKFRDHLMDAVRYAVYTYGQKYLNRQFTPKRLIRPVRRVSITKGYR